MSINETVKSIRDMFENLSKEHSVSEIIALFVDDKYMSTWTLLRVSDTGFVAKTTIDRRMYRVRYYFITSAHITVSWEEI